MKVRLFTVRRIVVIAFLLLAGRSAIAATNIWSGTSNSNWVNDGNWSLTHAPQAGEDVVITNIGARSVILSTNTPQLASFTMSTGTLVFTNWTTALNASQVILANGAKLTLPAAFTNGGMSNRIVITCSDMLIATGASINADGRGYAQKHGPGASATVTTSSSGGAGHGGIGGISGHNYSGGSIYNTASNPVAPGSGASGTTSCSGGAGGGAVQIDTTGRITIHGTISANGTPGTINSSRDGGGGSGGSILIRCETLAGTNGAISANGATTSTLAGGGGGGRVAIHYNLAAQALIGPPSVSFSASPGSGYPHKDRYLMADWGTLFFSDSNGIFRVSNVVTGFSGHIVIPGGIQTFAADSLTLVNACLGFDENPFAFQITNAVMIGTNAGLLGRGTITFSCSTLTNAGIVKFGSNSTVSIADNLTMTNAEFDLRWGSTLSAGGSWQAAGASAVISLQGVEAGVTNDIRLSGGAIAHILAAPTNATPGAWGARLRTGGDLSTESGAWIYPYSDTTNGGSPLFQCAHLLVAAGSGINADGRGYAVNKGPGAGVNGSTDPGAGGGHGGRGGDSSSSRLGGNAYGNAVEPVHAGSGGGEVTSNGGSGGPGGGVIRIEAVNLILVNGTLTACGIAGGPNASNREGGGGAGGSVFLIASAIAGTNGVVRADGGKADYSATWGGAGGGGRIAIRYDATAQAALPRPSIRFTANPGASYPWARQWLTADWGTLCFPDASLVFAPANTMSGFGGHITITNGSLTAFTTNSLNLSDAWIGFESPGFAFQIAGPLTVQTNGGLIGRVPFSLACSSLTNLGVVRTAGNAAFTVAGGVCNSNALFSMRGGSTVAVGGDLENAGSNGQLALEGVDAAIAGNLLVRTGALVSVFSIATNGAVWDWGARVTAGDAIQLDAGAWIHPYAEPNNGGAPLFQCRSLVVAAGGGVNADGRGYAQNRGPGVGAAGGSSPGAGGGHGGRGGNSSSGRVGGSANGRSLFPTRSGSGGGSTASTYGGAGGGVIRMESLEAVQLDGTLTANGANGGYSATDRQGGGGAGGSILIVAHAFSGSTNSLLSAAGGIGSIGTNVTFGAGGGGGGRIAIWNRATTTLVAQAETDPHSVNMSVATSAAFFGGSASVLGGSGINYGTNGVLEFITVFTKPGALMLVR